MARLLITFVSITESLKKEKPGVHFQSIFAIVTKLIIIEVVMIKFVTIIKVIQKYIYTHWINKN